MTWARGRALLGVLAFSASALWVLAGAGPAAAAVCSFGIASPAAGSVSPTAEVRVTGAFEVAQGVPPTDRTLTVTFLESPGPLPPTVTRRGHAPAEGSDDVGPAGRYDVPIGPLSHNGRYKVRVTAAHDSGPVLTCDGQVGMPGDASRSADLPFGVSVRAQPPTNVRAAFDAAARTVTVTWGRSGDPDIVGYTVTRRVGAAAATAVQVPPEPLSWTDRDLPPGAATITYSVQAARAGANPGVTSALSSPLSATLQVPARPPASTPTTPPGGAAAPPTTKPFVLGNPAGATTTPPVLDPAAGVDGAPGAPAGPEGAASQTQLPDLYGVDDVGGTMALDESGDQPPADREGGGTGGEGAPALAYLASGLLSTVIAAQILWLRREAARPEPVRAVAGEPPLEPLAGVAPLAPPPGDDDTFGPPAEAVPEGGALLWPPRSGGPAAPLLTPGASNFRPPPVDEGWDDPPPAAPVREDAVRGADTAPPPNQAEADGDEGPAAEPDPGPAAAAPEKPVLVLRPIR